MFCYIAPTADQFYFSNNECMRAAHAVKRRSFLSLYEYHSESILTTADEIMLAKRETYNMQGAL